MTLHLLVVEGNIREVRESHRAASGKTASERYAEVLIEIAPDARCDLCFPTDEGANLPDAAGLEAYDGVAITGSALNLYDGGQAVTRQIELARAVFAARTPFFGSCWGLQVATAAAGGDVFPNPLGREIGLARNIALNEAGRAHPMLMGRPPAFDAICTHLDVVTLPPHDATTLAGNAMSAVQAAEIVWNGGRFWGVQYHPEYSFREIAAIIERRAPVLTREGFFRGEADARPYCDDLRLLDAAAAPRDVAWRLGIGEEAVDPRRRRTELANFIEAFARPEKSRRGRA
jgi:GMP synthase (glutamine-hydrolysing)